MSTPDLMVHNDRRSKLFESGLRLVQEGGEGVKWPDEKTQLNYTGASGEELLRRTVDFVAALVEHVPTLESAERWKGLDYGAGWGRIASVMEQVGSPAQLDCVDAWSKSVELARNTGIENRLSVIPSLLQEDDLPRGEYDFIYSYSIFTHLPEIYFVNNARMLVDALKPGGILIFTVREARFIDFLRRTNRMSSVEDRLDSDGYWFGNAQNDGYGDTVVSVDWLKERLRGLGRIDVLGTLKSEPFQVLIKLEKPA